jgi:hypothetical protein
MERRSAKFFGTCTGWPNENVPANAPGDKFQTTLLLTKPRNCGPNWYIFIGSLTLDKSQFAKVHASGLSSNIPRRRFWMPYAIQAWHNRVTVCRFPCFVIWYLLQEDALYMRSEDRKCANPASQFEDYLCPSFTVTHGPAHFLRARSARHRHAAIHEWTTHARQTRQSAHPTRVTRVWHMLPEQHPAHIPCRCCTHDARFICATFE